MLCPVVDKVIIHIIFLSAPQEVILEAKSWVFGGNLERERDRKFEEQESGSVSIISHYLTYLVH